ncbi:MAG: hypothetical protein R3B46_03405 [Phycisphaerales bacterium]
MKVSWEVISRRSDAFVVRRRARSRCRRRAMSVASSSPRLYSQPDRGIHYVNPAAMEGNQ